MATAQENTYPRWLYERYFAGQTFGSETHGNFVIDSTKRKRSILMKENGKEIKNRLGESTIIWDGSIHGVR